MFLGHILLAYTSIGIELISAIVITIMLSVRMKNLSEIPNKIFCLVINKSWVSPQKKQRMLDLINNLVN